MPESDKRGVSMADVATLAGVSAQTVSRVSNGSDAVRPETKNKVLKAMNELGYRPNFAARALKRGRFKAIGVVLFDIGATGNLKTLEGITSAATEHGYAVTLTMVDWSERPTLAKAVENMRTLPVDGVIVILERMVPDFITFTPPPGLAVTVITTEISDTCSTIDSDQYGCSSTVVEHFLDHGHKNVYYVSGPDDSIASGTRERGWRDTLRTYGITPPAPIHGDWKAESGYDAGLRLAGNADCTAVYAANDIMAYGLILGLRAAGKRVPEDVSIVGVDDSLRDVVPRLGLTTMRLHFAKVGRMAFEETIAAIEDEHHDVMHRLVPGTLIVRDSVSEPRR